MNIVIVREILRTDIVAIQICNSDPYNFITLQDSSHNLLWVDPFHDGLFVYTIPKGINTVYMVDTNGVNIGSISRYASRVQEWWKDPVLLTRRVTYEAKRIKGQ